MEISSNEQTVETKLNFNFSILAVFIFILAVVFIPYITERQDIASINYPYSSDTTYIEQPTLRVFLNGFYATIIASFLLSIPVIIALLIFFKKRWGYFLWIPVLLLADFVILSEASSILSSYVNSYGFLGKSGKVGGINLMSGEMIPTIFISFPIYSILLFLFGLMISYIKKFKVLVVLFFILIFYFSIYKVYTDSLDIKSSYKESWIYNQRK